MATCQDTSGRLYEGWIALSTGQRYFSTFVKLAVDRYNFRLRFRIYKLEGFFEIYCRVQIRSFTALRLVLRRLHFPLSGG